MKNAVLAQRDQTLSLILLVICLKSLSEKGDGIILEDAPFDGKDFIPDLVGFLKSGEMSINGKVMKQRAEKLKANLGQKHAEHLLKRQKLIPKECRKYFLVFPGTVRRHPDGARIPYLRWIGTRWCLDFFWLESDWDSQNRLVRYRKH